MAIKALNKSKASPLANPTSENKGELKAAAIFAVDREGTIIKNDAGIFLLNPTTIQDTKSANWTQQQVPGQSDPVLQWTSSGPRTLTFQALVTVDTSNYVSGQVTQPGVNSNPLTKLLPYIGGIAAAFAKVTVPKPDLSKVSEKTEFDISQILNYYRSLLYPTYNKNSTALEASPPLVVLYMGNSIAKIDYGDKITTTTDVWVITNLDIQVTKFLPNLAPMEAIVNFQLTQYTIRSFDRGRFLI